MITILQTEATAASANLDYVLTHECSCAQRVCCRRLVVGVLCTLLFVLPVVAVMQANGALNREALFSIGAFSILMAFVALVVTLTQCRRYVFCPTGRPLHRLHLYFGKGDLEAVRRFVETGGGGTDDEATYPVLPAPQPNGPVMLYALWSDDGEMAFCRLMHYEGFGYVPVGRDHLYTGDDAARMRAAVRQASPCR